MLHRAPLSRNVQTAWTLGQDLGSIIDYGARWVCYHMSLRLSLIKQPFMATLTYSNHYSNLTFNK